MVDVVAAGESEGGSERKVMGAIDENQDFVNSVQENYRNLALALLEKAKDICTSCGVRLEMVTEVGDPKTPICSAVQRLNINLLVLGEHGLGRIKRALIGSVSSYCGQNAKCPVLVVKKP